MKQLLLLFFLSLIFINVKAQTVTEGLITATSFDKIKKSTTLQELKKIYGNKNISEDIEYAAEGMDSFRVTKVFKDTKKELVVYWVKNKRHKIVSGVDAYQKNSPYHTSEGLHAGSTLDEFVKANGKKISFTGFGWDYGGGIVSFHKGKLEKSRVYFSLGSEDNIPEKLLGDIQLHSDMPLVKKNLKKIYISKISVSFE